MLTWIQTQAKWVIVIGIVFISAGLLLIDTQSMAAPALEPVAVVNGQKVDYSEFQGQYSRRTNVPGGGGTEQEKAQLRRQILNEYAQRDGLRKAIDELAIGGSDIESYDYLLRNPPAEVRQMPMFLTDSVFDLSKWQAFYMSDSVTQLQGLSYLEANIKANTIPMNQLSMFLAMGIQATDLEARFKIGNSQNRFKLQYISVPVDSFSADKPSQEAIDAYFASAKDSFFVTEDQAKAEMVFLPIRPTEKDFEVQKEIAQDYLHEIKNGVAFEKVAVNSDDEATASLGGSLGDYKSGMGWPKAVREAAFKLDSGAVSGVVRSRLGFHIVKSHGKKVVDGDTLVKAAHILTKVIAGTETVTALKEQLEEQHASLAGAANWEEFAKSNKLKFKKTAWFKRGGAIDEGYFSGLSSFVFSEKSQEGISDVIANDSYVAVFKADKVVKAGERLKGAYLNQIRKYVKQEQKEKKALEFIKGLSIPEGSNASITKWAESQGKVQYDTTDFVGLESSVSRFGFANPKVGQIFKAEKNKWVTLVAGRYAFKARWVENQPALPQQYERDLARTKQNLEARSKQMASTLWMNSLIDQAVVEENLYKYYSE